MHRVEQQYFRDLTPAPFTLMGLALSIFLGFRNNACYERGWEARHRRRSPNTLLLHRTAWLFCMLLPFGPVSTLGLATPVMSVLLGYAFFGLDALGEELEQPFGTSQNAIALDAMVREIEIAALETLGETDLPQALMPREFVLL